MAKLKITFFNPIKRENLMQIFQASFVPLSQIAFNHLNQAVHFYRLKPTLG